MVAGDRGHMSLQSCYELIEESLGKVAPAIAVHLRVEGLNNSRIESIGGLKRLGLEGLPEQTLEREDYFDLASLTKSIGTTLMIARLYERGWLRWHTPVQKILPFFRFPNIEIRHLLTHTSGLPAYETFYKWMSDSYSNQSLSTVPVEYRQMMMRQMVLSVEPTAGIDETVIYSDLNFMLLGFMIEELTRWPLDKTLEQELWKPLGLNIHFVRTNDPPFRANRKNYVATTQCPWRGDLIQGQVEDENAWAMGGYGGHAGAFGRLDDLIKLGVGLMEGRVLQVETLQAIWSSEPPVKTRGRTLGWDLPSGERPAIGTQFSKRSVGHLGYTGTSLWIDPDAGFLSVILSNRTHPNRGNDAIREFRYELHERFARHLFEQA